MKDGPLLIDCHSDVMIDVYRRQSSGDRRILERVHLPELRKGGVGACLCTVGGDIACLSPLGTDRPLESAAALLDALERDLAGSEEAVRLAGSVPEIRALADQGILAIVPTLEGAAPFRGDPENVGVLYERGVRVVGLTWNTRNEVAVGLGMDGPAGLTDAGRAVMAEMNRAGMMVDVSHAAPGTFWDVVVWARAPFIASHSNARAVHDHPRNLDDEQLRAVRDAGGMVGIVLYPAFVASPPVTLDRVLDHLEYMAELIGIDCIGIGADFIDYAIEETIAEMEERGIPYSDSDFVYPDGVESWSSLSNILEGMARRGFSSDEVARVAGENLLRVMADVQRAAT